MPREFETIALVVDQCLATLKFDRPQTLNSFTVAMLDELLTALDRVRNDDRIRALLITGSGRGFSAGIDLAEGGVTPGSGDAGRILETHLNPIMERLMALPVPLVTAVNGPAAGAGCSLALAGDIVIAGRSAYFLQAFINIGLVPDMGATWLLPRLVGCARATAMLLLGERVGASEALDWGLIYKVVDDAALMDEATAIAARLAKGPTRALAMARQTIRSSLEGSLTDALRRERQQQCIAGLTEDFVEGVAAFAEKRPAAFVGR